MNEQSKTITTQLTHDIIKKDFFALHWGFVNILRFAFGWVYIAVCIPLWLALLAEGNVLFAVLLAVPLSILAVGIAFCTVKLIVQTIKIATGRYTVVTGGVAKRVDRYQMMAHRILTKRHNFTMKTDRITFGKHGSFQLERHTYYKWSPLFELTDDQIFEHAQLGAKYHLIMVGKNIVMIYNAETFLLK